MKDSLRIGESVVDIQVDEVVNGQVEVWLGDSRQQVQDLRLDENNLSFTANGRRWNFSVLNRPGSVSVNDGTACYEFQRVEPGLELAEEASAGELTSKMPGTVLKLLHKSGATVNKGAVLLILEAMKMEHEVCAPADGTVRGYPFKEGDRVMPGDLLVEFEAG